MKHTEIVKQHTVTNMELTFSPNSKAAAAAEAMDSSFLRPAFLPKRRKNHQAKTENCKTSGSS